MSKRTEVFVFLLITIILVFSLTPFYFPWKGFLLFNLQEVRASALTNVINTVTNTKVSTTTTHQIDFTTYTSIPKDGKILITFPSGFNIQSVSFNSWSGFDGGRTISTSSQTITITRDGTGTTSTQGLKYITLNYVVNTSTTGTQYQVTVETQDSTGTTLDGPTNSFYFSICTNSSLTNTYLELQNAILTIKFRQFKNSFGFSKFDC